MRLESPNWGDVGNDDGWIMYLLLNWSQHVSPTTDFIHLHTRIQTRRPDIHEQLDLEENRVRNSRGDLFAEFGTKCEFSTTAHAFTQAAKPLDFRFTDISTRKTSPFMFYYQIVSEYLPLDRPNVCKLQMKLFNSKIEIPVGGELVTKFARFNDLQWQFQVMHANTMLCQCSVELFGSSEPRYDMSRRVDTAKDFMVKSMKTRTLGNVPVEFTTDALENQLAVDEVEGYGFMRQSTILLSEIWDHAFPVDGPFFKQVQANGQLRLAVLWRSVAVQVFDKRVSTGAAMRCVSWIDRTGSSSFEIRTDFYLQSEPSKVMAATRYTLIQVDIASKRPAPLLYDRAWAEQRYLYGKQSPITRDSFEIKIPKDAKWSSPAFSYKLTIREADQDLNAHVNSGRYFVLVNDARFAAQQAGYLPNLEEDTQLTPKFTVDYNQELHKTAEHAACIQVRYVVAGNKLYIRYEFLKRKDDTGGACTILNTEIGVKVKGNNKL